MWNQSAKSSAELFVGSSGWQVIVSAMGHHDCAALLLDHGADINHAGMSTF